MYPTTLCEADLSRDFPSGASAENGPSPALWAGRSIVVEFVCKTMKLIGHRPEPECEVAGTDPSFLLVIFYPIECLVADEIPQASVNAASVRRQLIFQRCNRGRWHDIS